MKYHNVGAFEKHLKEATPNHLSPVYLIGSSSDFERRKVADQIIHSLCLKGEAQVVVIHSLDPALDHLNTGSLFGGQTIVFLDGVDKLKKAELERLALYVAKPSTTAFLILGASQLKPLAELYQKGKKEMVVLDLSDEKPWEKQRRLQEWLTAEASRSGKKITTDATAYLLQHVGPEMALLYQELQKLLCFVGEKNVIGLSEVEAILCARSSVTGWQLAENLVLGKELPSVEQKDDLAFLLPLVGQLRYQLQMAYQVAEVVERNGSPQGLFPQLRPQALERYVNVARQKNAAHFRKGLLALFEFELSLKSTSTDPGLLFDRFTAELR